jgi:hypothetical protein
MSEQKVVTSSDTAALESDAFPNAPPHRQATGLRDAGTSRSGGEHPARKPPRITESAPGKPLKIDMKPIDFERLLPAFGTAEPTFATLMLGDLIVAACDRGLAHPDEINGALAAVTGLGARDETEGMLATQMVATYLAAMRALRHLRDSETVAQQDSNGNLAVKLLRTYTMQLEALQRYRGKGQQKVTVEHVHVNAGGQAIVGAVHSSAAKKSKEPA